MIDVIVGNIQQIALNFILLGIYLNNDTNQSESRRCSSRSTQSSTYCYYTMHFGDISLKVVKIPDMPIRKPSFD